MTLSQDAITTWAKGDLSAKTDSVGTARTYTRPDGVQESVVAGGVYGWSINGAEAAQDIYNNIMTGSPTTLELPCYTTAATYSRMPGLANPLHRRGHLRPARHLLRLGWLCHLAGRRCDRSAQPQPQHDAGHLDHHEQAEPLNARRSQRRVGQPPVGEPRGLLDGRRGQPHGLPQRAVALGLWRRHLPHQRQPRLHQPLLR